LFLVIGMRDSIRRIKGEYKSDGRLICEKNNLNPAPAPGIQTGDREQKTNKSYRQFYRQSAFPAVTISDL